MLFSHRKKKILPFLLGNGVEEAYENISTVVLNILQTEFSTAPVAE
jgi:hypothetical protein